MSLVSTLRPMIDQIRALPGKLGLHQHVVTKFVRTYTSHVGRGTYAETSKVLTCGGQNIHARHISEDEAQRIFQGGNEWHDGDFLVGPITPECEFTASDFNVTASTPATIYYTIAGPGIGSEQGVFKAHKFTADRPFRYMIWLRRTELKT